MKTKSYQRALSLLLSLIMCVAMLPVSALAAEGGAGARLVSVTVKAAGNDEPATELTIGHSYEVLVEIAGTGAEEVLQRFMTTPEKTSS